MPVTGGMFLVNQVLPHRLTVARIFYLASPVFSPTYREVALLLFGPTRGTVVNEKGVEFI